MSDEPDRAAGRWGRLVLLGLLAAATAVTAAAAGGAGGRDTAPPEPNELSASGGTVAPGSALPTGTDCAGRVSAEVAEVRPENAEANGRTGDGVRVPDWTSAGYAPEFNSEILPRIDGAYRGTTDQILQWGACKWGLPPDVVRAMAVEESNWRQSTVGDFSSNPSDCVRGDTPPCPTSFGIMQVKHLFRPGSYPLAARSTAFNVDYALGAVRGCYEGWVTYLDGPDAGGDLWGCVGWHYSGEWYDEASRDYIGRVRDALAEAPWTRW